MARFELALKRMREGHKMRLSSWKKGCYVEKNGNAFLFHGLDNHKTETILFDWCEERDWEIYEENWNLKDNIDRSGTENKYFEEDVIKCKQLIIEDFDRLYGVRNDNDDFYKFIENRFGF